MGQNEARNESTDREMALGMLAAALALKEFDAFMLWTGQKCHLRHVTTNTIAKASRIRIDLFQPPN